MEKKGDLNGHWCLNIQKLMHYKDFHIQPSLLFLSEKEKNPLLIKGVGGEWPDWFKQIERKQQLK